MPCAGRSAGLDITCCIVGIVTGMQAGAAGGLIPGWGQDSFLFSKIPPPIQWVPSFFPMYETGHSPPSSAKVKNKCSCTSAPPVCVCGMVLGILWNLSVHHSVYNSTVLNCTQSQQQPVQICIHCLSKT